jgi:exonuclease III
MGFGENIFDIEGWVIRRFSMSCDVINKRDINKFRVTTVYGAAEEDKQDFLDELHKSMQNEDKPIIIGGDFNLVRYLEDKSNRRVDFNGCDKFNEWIDKHCMLEINLLGRGFTWSNNQGDPIMSHIDRVFL